MDIKMKLEQLKIEQKERILEKEVVRVKSQIINEFPSFHQHYRFANQDEVKKVNLSFSALPPQLGTYPSFSSLHNVKKFEPIKTLLNTQELDTQGKVWCKFATSTLNIEGAELIPYGTLEQFIKDIDQWICIGSPIILLYENMQEFIFLDWHTHAIKATMTIK